MQIGIIFSIIALALTSAKEIFPVINMLVYDVDPKCDTLWDRLTETDQRALCKDWADDSYRPFGLQCSSQPRPAE